MKAFPFRVIDLTHALSQQTPTWDGSCGFHHSIDHDYDPHSTYRFRTHKVAMKEGIGTHMDAPAHCFKGAKTIDQLPLDTLIAPCVVVDISHVATARYSLSVQDIEAFEAVHGMIEPGSFVMIRTGWEKFWGDAPRYHNNHQFPSVSSDAAMFLLKRYASGIGIDTLSPDRPEDGYPVHALFLGAGKYIVENVAQLEAMPPKGAFVGTFPMKIAGGTEAPVRLVGFAPSSSEQPERNRSQ